MYEWDSQKKSGPGILHILGQSQALMKLYSLIIGRKRRKVKMEGGRKDEIV